MVDLSSSVDVDGWSSGIHGEATAFVGGSSVIRNFFIGGGSLMSNLLVSVSEIQMGDDALVTVLTLVMRGTESSSMSLSSVSKRNSAIGVDTG